MVLSFQIFIVLISSIQMVVGDSSCGIVKLHQQVEIDSMSDLYRRIVGGSESEEGAWPWQVALLFHDRQGCGGSLVASDWVVSAAHCFHDFFTSTKPANWTVVLGEHHLGNQEVFEQRRGVEAIYLHPKYSEEKYDPRTPPENDIALLRLSEHAVYDKYVSPICLLPRKMKFPWGKECYVTGWGHTQWNGTKADILQEAKVRLVPRKVCNRDLSYNGTIHKSALCAGFEKGGVDTCQGDSGGPLLCEYDGRFYLTGVTSWGLGCAKPHKYGVYGNMLKLTSWVKKMMKKYNKVHL